MTKQVSAYQKFIRQTPRKLRLVADMVRNMNVENALIQLAVAGKFAAEPLRKVIIQGKASAIQQGIDPKTLKIKSLLIEEGPTFKRWQAVSRGRAHSILKRSCHIKMTFEGTDTAALSVKPPKETEKKEGK